MVRKRWIAVILLVLGMAFATASSPDEPMPVQEFSHVWSAQDLGAPCTTLTDIEEHTCSPEQLKIVGGKFKRHKYRWR